ncbi:hypothetical protein PBAL39_17081 [Pedobacter sp. BAL39]|nr:hypothetical protein PBAL39_17081 [Pedobacter sp. BAL39]
MNTAKEQYRKTEEDFEDLMSKIMKVFDFKPVLMIKK